MESVVFLFWLGVLAAFGSALWDCARWPRLAGAAWRRFRPVASAIFAIAALFFVINLARLGPDQWRYLLARAVRLVGIGVGASVFFCGGWVWVSRGGAVGLFERLRRRWTGLPGPRVRRSVVETAAASVGVFALSVALFWAVNPVPSPSLREFLDSQGGLAMKSGYLPLLILLAALWEEAAFRWYLFSRLEEVLAGWSWGRTAAIVGSSALWACGHAAMTDPAWVKVVQIFAIGCILAWRFRVLGLSGCVLVHLSMNLTALLDLAVLSRF